LVTSEKAKSGLLFGLSLLLEDTSSGGPVSLRIGMLLLLWRMRSWNLLLKFRFGWIGGIWIVFTINFVWLKITVELRGRVIRNRCERSRWSHIKIAVAYITRCSMGGGRIFWVVGCSQRSVACQIFGGEIPIVNRKLVNN